MSNLSFKLSADSQDFTKEMEATKASVGNVKKEMRSLTQETNTLETAYRRLTNEEKNSPFGKYLHQEIDKNIERLGDMKDTIDDVQQQISKLASDTAVWDGMAEAISVSRDVVSAFATSLGISTKEGTLAADAINLLARAQTMANAAISVGNALQKTSKIMGAITTLQMRAQAAATGQATVAQAAFNVVAKANPYVLLAMAIVGVVTALGSFIAFTGKAADAEEDEQKATERLKAAKDAYYDTYNDKLSTTMGNYSKLQNEWKNLKSASEKNQWIKDNSDAFHDLGYEITDTADAEKFFVQNEAAVIKSFVARAEAAALAAQQVEIFNQSLRDIPQVGESKSAQWFRQNGLSTAGRKDTNQGFMRFEYQYEFTEQDRQELIKSRLDAAREASTKLAELQVKAEQEANRKAADVGVKEYKKERDKKLKSGKKATDKVDIKIDDNSLTAAENKLKKLEEIRTKMSVDDPDLSNVIHNIEVLKKDIESKKIKLQIESPKTNVDLMSDFEKSLEQAVKNAEGDYMMAFLNNEVDKLDELYAAWERAIKARNDYNSTKELQSPEGGATSTGSLEFRKAKNGTFDKSIQGYSDAISALQNKIQTTDWSGAESGGAEKLQEYIELIQEYKEALEPLQKSFEDAMLTPLEKAQKKITSVGQAVQAVGELFSALGQETDDEGFQVMGIVAKAVATVALSFAQALNSCRTWVDWMAFGITGLSTMISMITSIKSLTAGAYANGGIVGGSSYYGDKILARVNSGETILNKRQQQRAWELMDNGIGGLVVTGDVKIKGSDLYLSLKNYGKVQSGIGKNIGIK